MAFPTNTTPPWKSYMATGNTADIVASTTVATAIGAKVDATSGQSLNQTLETPTITGGTATDTDISGALLSSTMTGTQAAEAIESLQGSKPTLFTPALLFGGESSGMEVSYPTCSYVATGMTVTFILQISLIYKGASTGSASISGLPYPCMGGVSYPVNILATGVNTDGNTIAAAIQANRIVLMKTPSISGSYDLVSDTDVENAATFTISGTYIMETE